jgi:hypothetical protein
MTESTCRARGQIVADFLAGCWRDRQNPLAHSPVDLELITQLLYDSGGAGLAWWRIRESDLSTSVQGELLHQSYRLQALQSAINEQRVTTAFRLLRDAGIEPILIKGWSVARLYPHPTLRAYGDIDLWLKPDQYSAALQILNDHETKTWWIDLHQSLSELQDRTIDDLFARSQLVGLRESCVRVLGAEDSLALMAVHFFKHSGWRPLWLCDIALMVESLPANFDWSVCLGSDRWRAKWIISAIALSQRLLGANIGAVPLPMRVERLPEWLVEAVLKQWGNLLQHDHLPVQPRPVFAQSLREPKHVLKEIRARWPNPIVATFDLRGQVNDLPRFPYQLGAFLKQAFQYVFA